MVHRSTRPAVAIAAVALGALVAGSGWPAWADGAAIMVGVNHKMRAYLYAPEGAGPFPAVLVLHTSGGLESQDTDYAQRLTQQGYFAVWLAATGKVQAAIGYYGAYSGAGTDKPLSRFRQAFSKPSSPVLILHGTSDGTVPILVTQTLAGIVSGASAPVELKLYDGVGHRFERDPSSPAATAASSDAWQRSLAFLQANLKPSSR
jgi:dienelactone hydrolase